MSWEALRDEINKAIGFSSPDESEMRVLRIAKLRKEKELTCSYRNLLFAKRLEFKGAEIPIPHVVFLKCCTTKKGKIGQRFMIVFDEHTEFSPTGIRAVFECPACKHDYTEELNPAKWLFRRCGLCKRCQKKLLHKTPSYQKTYELAIEESYGVKRPLQSKRIRKKMKETMRVRHGVDYAMQSSSVKKKHAEKMIERWGRPNFFSGLNPRKIWGSTGIASNIERDFVERLIKSLSENEIVFSCMTKQHVIHADGRVFFPDVWLPRKKMVIEFYGDYWHANPAIDWSKTKLVDGKQCSEIYEDDEKRIECIIESLNITPGHVKIVWESDYRVDRDSVVQECVTWIGDLDVC